MLSSPQSVQTLLLSSRHCARQQRCSCSLPEVEPGALCSRYVVLPNE